MHPGSSNERQSRENRIFRAIDEAFEDLPPVLALLTPKGVPRPDIFDEVPLWPYVSTINAKLARNVWSKPDRLLGKAWQQYKDRPYPRTTADSAPHVLVYNVYEHLMSNPLLPVAREEAKAKFKADGLDQTWDASPKIEHYKTEILQESEIRDISSWDLRSIQAWLRSRGLSTTGDKEALVERAQNDALKRHCGVMPLSDLTKWKIYRKEKYALQPLGNDSMSSLDMYTFAIHLSPYNPTYWTSRAYCHYLQGYFDLALGDAYRANLLCDVLIQGLERGRQPGLYTRVWHAIEQHVLIMPRENGVLQREVESLRQNGVPFFVGSINKALENITRLSLLALGCWHELDPRYNKFSPSFATRDRDSDIPKLRDEIVKGVRDSHKGELENNENLFWHERFQGRISNRQRYPYEPTDVERDDKVFIDTMNINAFHIFPDNACEVAPTEDFSISIFATRDIKPGELIYHEEPTIRGHLGPRRLRRDRKKNIKLKCENCQKFIRPIQYAVCRDPVDGERERCPCFPLEQQRPGPDERIFCGSKRKVENSCRELASQLHHFSSCGKDWTWLYDCMRPVVQEWQRQSYIVKTNDIYGTMHSLLLRNIFEITLHRRKNEPNLSPLEIDELLILDETGEHQAGKEWFPFSFAGNITVPFDILRCLGVDIFQDLTFDTWVIQKIMRKLLTNAVPCDSKRRNATPELQPWDKNKVPELPDEQDERIENERAFTDWDPSFMKLYLFPGFSLFRQVPTENAHWGYDDKVANRILVWAAEEIKEGEEITIRDQYYEESGVDPMMNVLVLPGSDSVQPSNDGDAEEEAWNQYNGEEWAELDEVGLSFYRNVKDSNPPNNYKRKRETRPRGFRHGGGESHYDYEQWVEDLGGADQLAGETEAQWESRIKRLKREALAKYRTEQRERIIQKGGNVSEPPPEPEPEPKPEGKQLRGRFIKKIIRLPPRTARG